MTLKYNLESLFLSDFSASELSIIKLLVLESLSKYDNINEANCSGNIYKLLTTIRSKVHELSNEL